MTIDNECFMNGTKSFFYSELVSLESYLELTIESINGKKSKQNLTFDFKSAYTHSFIIGFPA